MDARYPEVQVQLSGLDGNAMMVIARVTRTLRESGVDETAIGEFCQEAMSGDYRHVLTTCQAWVTCE